MIVVVVAAGSVLAVMLTLGWAREIRLRRALQSLLSRLFNHWRNADAESATSTASRRDVCDIDVRAAEQRVR